MRPAFAKRYDRFTAEMEQAWLDDARAELVGDLSGTVIEIGAGTGKNLVHYPAAVTELVLTEPSPVMRDQLRTRVTTLEVPSTVRIVDAVADRLPLPDASADAVVSTLVLCSVPDLAGSVAEIARVLRPGGELRLVEHVGAPAGWERTAQRRLDRVWHWIEGSCHLDHDTGAALEAGGFDLSGLTQGRRAGMPPLFRTVLQGAALRGPLSSS